MQSKPAPSSLRTLSLVSSALLLVTSLSTAIAQDPEPEVKPSWSEGSEVTDVVTLAPTGATDLPLWAVLQHHADGRRTVSYTGVLPPGASGRLDMLIAADPLTNTFTAFRVSIGRILDAAPEARPAMIRAEADKIREQLVDRGVPQEEFEGVELNIEEMVEDAIQEGGATHDLVLPDGPPTTLGIFVPGESMTVCHRPDSDDPLTLTVKWSERLEHYRHGDHTGGCRNEPKRAPGLNGVAVGFAGELRKAASSKTAAAGGCLCAGNMSTRLRHRDPPNKIVARTESHITWSEINLPSGCSFFTFPSGLCSEAVEVVIAGPGGSPLFTTHWYEDACLLTPTFLYRGASQVTEGFYSNYDFGFDWLWTYVHHWTYAEFSTSGGEFFDSEASDFGEWATLLWDNLSLGFGSTC